MRKFIIVLMVFLFAGKTTIAQTAYPIYGTEQKVVSLMFPSPIKYFVGGVATRSQDLVIATDSIVPNLLNMVMAQTFNITTNLLVVTTDNRAYSFEVSYKPQVSKFVYIIQEHDAINSNLIDSTMTEIIETKGEKSEKEVIKDDAKILEFIRKTKGTFFSAEKSKKGGVTLSLNNIFVKGNEYYFEFALDNNSSLDYIIDFLVFLEVTENKKIENTAVQDRNIDFEFFNNDLKVIKAKTKESVIVKIDQFTLDDSKLAKIEIYEKEGGRHLSVRFGNYELLSTINLDIK